MNKAYVEIPPMPNELKEIMSDMVCNDAVAVQVFNDDKTPVEFVVQVLEKYFQYEVFEAAKIAVDIHRGDHATVIFADPDVAKRLIDLVRRAAEMHDYPLVCKAVGI